MATATAAALAPPSDLDALLTEHAAAIAALRTSLGSALPATWDDLWLLRFVLSNPAVDMRVTKALAAIKWRHENAAMLADAAAGRPHELTAALAPHFIVGIHGASVFGEPLMILRVGISDGAAFVAAAPPERLCDFLMYTREVLYMRCDAETRRQRKLIKTFSIIDAAGTRLSQFNREAALLLDRTGKLSDAIYPQLLARTVIVHPPAIFQAAWAICKVFVTAKALEKVVVCGGGSSALSALASACPYASRRFDPAALPTFVGGTCQCTALGGCICGVPNSTVAWPGGATGPSVLVGARCCHDVVLGARAAGVTLSWEFTVIDHSLDISASLAPAAGSGSGCGAAPVTLLAARRYKSSDGQIAGSAVVPAAGTVTFRFSNEHTLLTSKRVAIAVRLSELPRASEAAPQAAAVCSTAADAPASTAPSSSVASSVQNSGE
jgi:hypothetical protein